MPEQGVNFMLLIFFGMGVLFFIILLFLGYSQASFPMLFLSMFVLLLLGLFLYSEGLEVPTGTAEFPVGSRNFITTYTVHTTDTNFIVNVLAATFFYIPLAGLLLSTLMALRGMN